MKQKTGEERSTVNGYLPKSSLYRDERQETNDKRQGSEQPFDLFCRLTKTKTSIYL